MHAAVMRAEHNDEDEIDRMLREISVIQTSIQVRLKAARYLRDTRTFWKLYVLCTTLNLLHTSLKNRGQACVTGPELLTVVYIGLLLTR